MNTGTVARRMEYDGRPAHTFRYSPIDREGLYVPPDLGFFTATGYAYALDRELATVFRPDGTTVTFGYEPTGGRLLTRTQGGETLTVGYHPTTGQVTSLTSDLPGVPSLTFAHDGRLPTGTTWTGGLVAGQVALTYDAFFRPVGTTLTDGAGTALPSLARGYDLDGLLTQTGALTLTRHPQHGLVTGTTLGAVTDSRTYTAFGELATYTAGPTGGGTPYLRLTYDDATHPRDPLGRIVARTEEGLGAAAETTTYGYDLRGRLATVTRPTGTVVTYAYDANGNRQSRAVNGVVVESGTYDAQDRLLSYGGATYTYTASGELAATTVGTDVTQYAYDAVGNLRHVGLPAGTAIDYVIDPLDRRVGKLVDGVLVQGFLYEDRLRVAAELDGAGRITRRFVYGTRINVPEYMVTYDATGSETGTYRLVTDHLGSPRLVIDVNSGAVLQRMEYDEFGRVLTDTNPGFQPFGFAGGLYDRNTGLVRFGARDYDAWTGRWTTKDPIQFRGHDGNLYAYAFNDPVNLIDPSGFSFSSSFAEGFVVGATSAAVVAGVALGAVALGVPAAAVTGTLFAAGVLAARSQSPTWRSILQRTQSPGI